ncbi:MAG: site-2 protease family protein [Candidatus Sericytochromatia bacterium]|nr:site-2 protease family protein [Candidatus Sericytochromatia bacterium]
MIFNHVNDPVFLAVLIPLFIVSITLHEFGHALTATWLGDSTARDAGRVTVNPFVHLDFFGTLFILLAGFGWAKPVPFDPNQLRWPRLGSFLVSAAGPFANFLLAWAALLALTHLSGMPAGASTWFEVLFSLNLMLMVFNLLPIPPLDGGNLLESLLPRRWLPAFQRLLPYGVVALLVLVLLPGANNPLRWLYALAARGMQWLV